MNIAFKFIVENITHLTSCSKMDFQRGVRQRHRMDNWKRSSVVESPLLSNLYRLYPYLYEAIVIRGCNGKLMEDITFPFMYTKLINFSNFHIEQHESLNIHIKCFLKEKCIYFQTCMKFSVKTVKGILIGYE